MAVALVGGLALIAMRPPASAQEPFRIGLSTPLSGPAVERGLSERRGLEMAISEINDAGGVLGRRLEAVVEDTACDPPVAEAAAKRLADDLHAEVILGGPCAPIAAALARVAAQVRVPVIVDITDSDEPADGTDKNTWSLQINPSEKSLTEGFVGYLKQQNASRIALIGEDDPASRAAAALFDSSLQAAGIAVITTEFIPAGATDFAPLLARLMARAPDHVLVAALGPSTAGFFTEYERFDWHVPVTGRFDLEAARNAVTAPFLAGGGLAGAAAASAFSTAVTTQPAQAFVGEFTERFGTPPDQHSFYAYQAVYVIADALRRAASDTKPDILAALRATDMPGMIGGTLAFDDHNQAHEDAVIIGIRDGRIIVLAKLKT